MAKKDKTKTAATVADDTFAAPSQAPAGGEGWKLTDDANRGKLMIFTPLREETKPAFGKAGERGETQQIIVADVVVVNEKKPEKSEEHSEVWVFQGYIKGALRGYIGQRKVLGRLQNTEDTTGAASEYGKPYWELEDASAEDVQVAKAYLDSIDPFAAPKADGEKAGKKKGKKS